MASFLLMMLCVVIEVFGRNVLTLPTPWAEESSRLFCVWSVFLGTASAWRRGAHIAINVIPRRLSGRMKYALELFVEVLSGLFLAALWCGTLKIMQVSYPAKTTALEISISYFYLALAVGLLGTVIFQADTILQSFRGLLNPPVPQPEER